MTTLLDLETEYNLRKLAPKIGTHTPDDARHLLWALDMNTTDDNQRIGMDDEPYYIAFLSDLLNTMDIEMTPKKAGALCRTLCLVTKRQSAGYCVAWNEKQLEILKETFAHE